MILLGLFTSVWSYAAAAAGVVAIIGAAWVIRRPRLRIARACPKCQYDMTATIGRTCPECGREAKSERTMKLAGRWGWCWRWRRRACAALLLLAVLCGQYLWRERDVRQFGWLGMMPTTVLIVISDFARIPPAATTTFAPVTFSTYSAPPPPPRVLTPVQLARRAREQSRSTQLSSTLLDAESNPSNAPAIEIDPNDLEEVPGTAVFATYARPPRPVAAPYPVGSTNSPPMQAMTGTFVWAGPSVSTDPCARALQILQSRLRNRAEAKSLWNWQVRLINAKGDRALIDARYSSTVVGAAMESMVPAAQLSGPRLWGIGQQNAAAGMAIDWPRSPTGRLFFLWASVRPNDAFELMLSAVKDPDPAVRTFAAESMACALGNSAVRPLVANWIRSGHSRCTSEHLRLFAGISLPAHVLEVFAHVLFDLNSERAAAAEEFILAQPESALALIDDLRMLAARPDDPRAARAREVLARFETELAAAGHELPSGQETLTNPRVFNWD